MQAVGNTAFYPRNIEKRNGSGKLFLRDNFSSTFFYSGLSVDDSATAFEWN